MLGAKPKPSYIHVTYPYKRPGPPDASNKIKYDPNVIYLKRLFELATPPVKDLRMIALEGIKCLTMNEEGTYLNVQTEAGAFCIYNDDIANLYFSHFLIHCLKIPGAPRFHLVHWMKSNFGELLYFLERASILEPEVRGSLKTFLNKPYLGFADFVPGLYLDMLGTSRARVALDGNYSEARDRLIILGLYISADILLYNLTRIPWLPDFTGDPRLHVISVDTLRAFYKNEVLLNPEHSVPIEWGPIVAIGSRSFTNEAHEMRKNHTNYLEAIDRALEAMFIEASEVMKARIEPLNDPDVQLKSIAPIIAYLEEITGIKIMPMAQLQILIGILLGINNIHTFGFEKVAQVHTKVKMSIPTNDKWGSVYEKSMEKVNLVYIQDILASFRRFALKYDTLINWLKVITLRNYTYSYDDFSIQIEGIIRDEFLDQFIMYDGEQKQSKVYQPAEIDKKIAELFGINPENLGDPDYSILKQQRPPTQQSQNQPEEGLNDSQQYNSYDFHFNRSLLSDVYGRRESKRTDGGREDEMLNVLKDDFEGAPGDHPENDPVEKKAKKKKKKAHPPEEQQIAPPVQEEAPPPPPPEPEPQQPVAPPPPPPEEPKKKRFWFF